MPLKEFMPPPTLLLVSVVLLSEFWLFFADVGGVLRLLRLPNPHGATSVFPGLLVALEVHPSQDPLYI